MIAESLPSFRSVLFTLALNATVVWAASSTRATDCNANGVEDRKDIEEGRSADCDGNGILDECDLGPDGWILERKAGAALGNNGERLIVEDMDADGHVDAVSVNR